MDTSEPWALVDRDIRSSVEHNCVNYVWTSLRNSEGIIKMVQSYDSRQLLFHLCKPAGQPKPGNQALKAELKITTKVVGS